MIVSQNQCRYIAGGAAKDPGKCTRTVSGSVTEAECFRATHEEADDRIMLSVHQIYKRVGSQCVTIVTSDTDIITVLLYHLNNSWKGKSMYVLKKGKMTSDKQQKELYPLHKLITELEPEVINALPASHCLTGCDTVAKVGTKAAMLQALKDNHHLLVNFGKERLGDEVILSAEKFLVSVVAPKTLSHCSTFDDLRVNMHRKNISKKKRFIDLPCTSSAIKENIKRAYFQVRLWLEAPFWNAAERLDPNDYGLIINHEDSSITPVLFEGPQTPPDVPKPCTCKLCAKSTCRCRVLQIPCCDYCECKVDCCQNPSNVMQ